MFKKILVANRGEIAVRIIRACKELGVKTVAVYSEADKNSLHTMLADESICIGPAPSNESYLKFFNVIGAAEATGCDALHPGYGFLAENPTFAEAVEESGIKFIGPPPDVMRKMGDKSLAKKMMEEAGLPVIPGSKGEVNSLKEAKDLAKQFGYPVLLKASLGGGGKGMRLARDERELETGYRMAKAEAKVSFGDEKIYLEKYIESPRHVEIQLIADTHGNVIHLGERECSIQRRHQKLIEEAPSPAVNPELREKMGDAAVRGAKYINYISAGTVEFLLDKEGNFYFMEMNTRIQVEHPVTEIVTSIDLIKEQILVAAGEKLSINKSFLMPKMHAIECRINAEDPEREFMPTPGKIEYLHLPGGPGVRVDSHIYAGYTIPPYYDSLIAKVIAYGNSREEAIKRMKRALEEFYIEGIKTTISFHLKVLEDPQFKKGEISTDYLNKFLKK